MVGVDEEGNVLCESMTNWFGVSPAALDDGRPGAVAIGASGYPVVAYSSGGALKLAVVDGRLGWGDAQELVAAIKRRDPDTGVVVISDQRPPLDVTTKMINLGVATLLSRPLDATRFRAGVQKIGDLMGSGKG